MRSMTPLWTRAALSLACITALAWDVAAEPCRVPDWFAKRSLKPAKGNVVGYGAGDTVDAARVAARRDIGAQVAKRQFKKISASNEFRESVNSKIYAADEIRKATGFAIGTSIQSFQRIKAEQVCQTEFVALELPWQDATRQYEQDRQFVTWIRRALEGTLDQVEQERAKKFARGVEEKLRKELATLERINRLLAVLKTDVALEDYQREPLSLRLQETRLLIQSVRDAKWDDERAKAHERLASAMPKVESYVRGVEALTRREYVDAANRFRTLAGEGDAWAQLTFGMLVLSAKGARRDEASALEWFKKAAEQGNPLAQMIVGMLYFSGRGVKADADVAFQWLKKAVSQGWTCQVELGSCRKSL